MKKKIVLLLIFLVSFMGFGIEVKAVDDYSLLYDVTSFDISETQIKIKGFAVRHNFDNDDPRIMIYFEDSSENKVYFSVDKDKDVKKNSLYDWYCIRSGNNVCSSTSYRYDGVVFDATLNLSDFSNSSVFKYNTDYTLKIQVCLKNDGCSIVENLGVPEGVVSGKNDDIEINTSTNMMKIYTSSSRLLSSDWGYGSIQSGYVYWEPYSTYKILSVIKGGSSCTSGSTQYDYCPNLYELSYGYIYDRYGNKYGCVKHGITGYASVGNQCSAYASAAWVKPDGLVTIKFKGSEDHICNDSSGTIDACTGGSVENNCSKMTVYATTIDGQNISAVVSIKESSTISPGEDDENFVDNYNSYFGIDYSKYNIVRGKTFHYALTYTNTASWSFVERNYGNVSESYGDKVIRDKMKGYYTEIGSNFASNVSIKSNDRKEFNTAGNWTCTGGTNEEFVTEPDDKSAAGKTTLTCKYELKYLDIDGNGEDSYNKLESSTSIGRNFYIPSLYNKNEFTWEISGPELTTVEVRTDKDNKDVTSPLLNVEINSNSNKCYINVVGSNVTPDTSGDPGYNPDTVYKDDKLYVYRSVSVNDPFPDGNIPENWNNVNLINRLKGSYQNISNPDYETVPLTTSVVNQIRSLDTIYTKWDDTITSSADNSGNNSFIRNTNYFNIIRGKHCKFGLFDSNCDERVR